MQNFSLKEAVSSSKFDVFLVDASGVLYNQEDVVSGAS